MKPVIGLSLFQTDIPLPSRNEDQHGLGGRALKVHGHRGCAAAQKTLFYRRYRNHLGGTGQGLGAKRDEDQQEFHDLEAKGQGNAVKGADLLSQL
jgi:hypothetical protein